MRTLIVMFSLVIFLCASTTMAQEHNRVGFFVGGGSALSTFPGGNTAISVKPNSLSPSFGFRSSPFSRFSVGAEATRFWTDGQTSPIGVMLKSDGKTPTMTLIDSVSTTDTLALGTLHLSFGKKNSGVRVFGWGGGGFDFVKQNRNRFFTAIDAKDTAWAAQMTAANSGRGFENLRISVGGGGVGILIARKWFGFEVKYGYLYPIGSVPTFRLAFFP